MKIIACYSIKGGVGKTACAVNLSYEVAQGGYRTLLIDLDPQGASSYYFRVRPAKKFQAKKFFTMGALVDASIRGSDFENLDILPASLHYRKFEALLGSIKNSRKRLRKTLKRLARDYDVIVLDCPPNIGVLSENIFVAADAIMVPVIPTTLSERTFIQLLDFFKQFNYPVNMIHGFFSMTQTNNRLHQETMTRLRSEYDRFFNTAIPLSADIERMGMHREPVVRFAARKPGAIAYQELYKELRKKLDLGVPHGVIFL
jgi:chromosome partitioning protein